MANLAIFAKTKSGIVINLSLFLKNDRETSYWQAECNGETCVVSFQTHDGKEYLKLNEIQVKKLLNVAVKKNTNSLIEVFGGVPSQLQKAFDVENANILKKEAENVRPTHVEFTWHTSDKYTSFVFFKGEKQIPYSVAKYSNFCKSFVDSTSYVEAKELGSFCTGGDYGDYSSWNYYKMLEADMLTVIEKGQKSKEENINAAAKKEADAKAACEAKFNEAKATGKRVLLSECFVSGSNIARKYREEDSDMGTICKWANPDGTTSESFSHAY